MSEHPPQQPNGEPVPGSGEQGVNSYGTDDPAKQAEIERARTEAAEERRQHHEAFQQYIEAGINEEDATALIEFSDWLREQHAQIQGKDEPTVAAQREGAETASAVNDPEHKKAAPPTPPRIYVRSLVDHTEGHDIGEWIDANQDVDELKADVQRILDRSLHAHWTGEPAEEWAIHDYEGFGSVRLHEYESLDVVSKLGQGIAEHGLAYAAWAEISDSLDEANLDRFTAAYIGEFESRAAFGEQVVSDHDVREVLQRHLPRWLVGYISIDHAGIAQELEIDGEVRFADHPGGVWAFNGRI